MNTEFEKKVIEDLEKSGFSSELRAIRTFLSCGWNCTGFANYFDLDQELITSVDLHSWKDKEKRLERLRYGVQFCIDGEVKKSEKPWVVFKEKNVQVIDNYINDLTYICGLTPFSQRQFRRSQAMVRDSVYAQLGWRAYSIHESFKKPEAPSRWYSAFIKVCKSAEGTLNARSKEFAGSSWNWNSKQSHKERFVVFVKPVVILDGVLLAASLSEQSEISIEEIKFAPVEFYYKSKHYNKGVYSVDIVTLEGLEEYIKLSDKRHQNIFDKVEFLAASAT